MKKNETKSVTPQNTMSPFNESDSVKLKSWWECDMKINCGPAGPQRIQQDLNRTNSLWAEMEQVLLSRNISVKLRYWNCLQLRSNKYDHSRTKHHKHFVCLLLNFDIGAVFYHVCLFGNNISVEHKSISKHIEQTYHNTNDRNVLSLSWRQEHRRRHNDVTINPEMESQLQSSPPVTMETLIRFSRVQYRSRPTGGSRGSCSIRHTMISVPSVPAKIVKYRLISQVPFIFLLGFYFSVIHI